MRRPFRVNPYLESLKAQQAAEAKDSTAEPASAASERPSKTQLKADAQALQKLGAELAALPQERLAAIPMPEALRDAIDQLRRTKGHEARRRQLQYVGKHMRAADAEPLREAVAAYQLGTATDALALHEAERWREELLADDQALTRWAAQWPDTDLQRLRSLVRAARKDAALSPEQRSGRGYRELFQFIKPHVGAATATQRTRAADVAEPADDPLA